MFSLPVASSNRSGAVVVCYGGQPYPNFLDFVFKSAPDLNEPSRNSPPSFLHVIVSTVYGDRLMNWKVKMTYITFPDTN